MAATSPHPDLNLVVGCPSCAAGQWRRPTDLATSCYPPSPCCRPDSSIEIIVINAFYQARLGLVTVCGPAQA
eukprot:scaffold408_cov388-Prasinococcus_capsulatus_cf.AAC.2